jgi:MoaA/NifB/PqqE/SkfB family radical SAM enzyme
MSTDFVKDILTEAASLGCLTVRFTGGEPLLREDLVELYVFARRLGMEVILFTNGRLITPELAAFLARIPPRRAVEVSVYGMRPESYDRAVGKKGAFSEFRRGVALLKKHQIPFIVKAPLLPFLKEAMEEFEAWAQTITQMGKKPGYVMNLDLRSRRDDPAKNTRIAKLRASPEEIVAMLARNPFYRKGMRQICGKFMGPPGDKLFACGAGLGTCIDAYGKAQMCMGLRDPGMVYDLWGDGVGANGHSPLRYVLTVYFPRLREMRSTNPEYLHRCARCFLKGLCDQCPAKSWMEHGTLDTPVEYLCGVAHAKARYLRMITDQENAWEVEDWRERVERFDQGHGSGFTAQRGERNED